MEVLVSFAAALRLGVVVAVCAALPTEGAAQGSRAATRPSRRPPLAVLPLPVLPVVRRGARAIHVDGGLADWPSALPALLLDHPLQVSGTAHKSWHGPDDLSARGALLWDEERLYVALKVRDDWARPFRPELMRSLGLPPPGDSIEFSFDPRRDSRRAGPDPGRREDTTFVFGLDGRGRALVVRQRRVLDAVLPASKARLGLGYDRKSKTYTLEAGIPWAEILPEGMAPKQGLALDLQVVVNDFDAVTDPLPQTRIGWTFGSGPKLSPFVYGTIVLAGPDWTSEEPPKRPPAPETHPGLPGRAFWAKLGLELGAARGSPPWSEALLRLDRRLAAWPRQDFVAMLARMQRRQNRELAGWLEDGVHLFFAEAMAAVLRRLERPLRAAHELIVLPGRGFVLRSRRGNFALDPCMPLAERLHEKLDAVLYTAAQDPLLRQDPLSFRMLATKKPVFAHVAFHLPGARFPPVEPIDPGARRTIGKDVELRVLGRKDAEGKVTLFCGYVLRWPDGFTFVEPSLSGTEDEVQPEKGPRTDVLVLDPDHPRAEALLERLDPKYVFLEGFLDGPRFFEQARPRNHRLSEAAGWIERWRAAGRRVLLPIPAHAFRFD